MTFDVNLKLQRAVDGYKVTGTVDERAPDVDPLAAMQAWLANIDAGELERASLEDMGLGSGSYTESVMAVLRRWAGGDP